MYKCIYNMGYIVPSKKLLEKEKLIEGKIYTIDIIKDIRSLKQNKYIYVAFQLIADWFNAGNENKEGEFYSSEKAKAKILYEIGHCDYYIAKEDGMKFGIIKGTRQLNIQEFSDLTEKIIQIMALKGLQILSPEEYFQKLNQ